MTFDNIEFLCIILISILYSYDLYASMLIVLFFNLLYMINKYHGSEIYIEDVENPTIIL